MSSIKKIPAEDVSNIFWAKSNSSTKHFSFDLNLEQHWDLKVRGSEIDFIMSMLQKSKDPLGFVVSISKVANLQGYFDLSNFYKKEMDIRAFDFEVAVQLQIEVKC